MFLQRLYAPGSGLARASAPSFRVDDRSTPIEDTRDGVVSFEFASDEQHGVSAAAQADFVAAFARERASLAAWCERAGWQPRFIPALRVVVAAKYKISRALVPAWEGRPGLIEFPARRVGTGTAAIAHELTHVYFPNGNRLLAEGFAIYLQSVLGGNPAFPNFGKPLHEVACDRLGEMVPGFAARDTAALRAIDLAALDAIPTPNPLMLAAAQQAYAEEHRSQGALYAIAGSFVQFLIEAGGLEKFRALYEATPLIDGALEAGSGERWRAVYAAPLGALATQWKSLLAGVQPIGAACQ